MGLQDIVEGWNFSKSITEYMCEFQTGKITGEDILTCKYPARNEQFVNMDCRIREAQRRNASFAVGAVSYVLLHPGFWSARRYFAEQDIKGNMKLYLALEETRADLVR